ncbi:DVU_1553 family AMP-dependent CoA ligase [uncultured Desulfosarcina sp.]|uniref:DVU_1553 family AMP-dependent CoA ligase n=1 Tax=uncultured Desulfosarcina sp. TaxID=218289 RepID=UPI0029C789C9|nr:AMP-binding protein [uncultured Desulfosarcina sp.]
MTTVPITPLENWVHNKIGLDHGLALTRPAIDRYQLQAFNRTLDHARQNSPFYREHLADLPQTVTGLERLAEIPFTKAEDIRRDSLALVCASQDRIARVVTLETSGTTGTPKRLFFTEEDQELTVDFFHHGMATLVGPGERVLILLPGQTPGSVGDLLVRGLSRLQVEGIVHGPVDDPAAAIDHAFKEKVDCLVGIPVQVLAMASHRQGPALAGQIATVLLSTDYVPDAIAARIERIWKCRVFKHYGMTEMGLGGGVECSACDGYHLREADLLVEIVDPATGLPLADGNTGEVVFTTLTRDGMPLIRYRTGDMAAFRLDSCACGTVLKTLGSVRARRKSNLRVGRGQTLSIGDLDERLFAMDGVIDYQARLSDHDGVDRLNLTIAAWQPASVSTLKAAAGKSVLAVVAIRNAVDDGLLTLDIQLTDGPLTVSTGTGKRRIEDCRERNTRR